MMSVAEEPKTPAAAPPQPSALLQKVIARLGPLVAEHQSLRGEDCIHVARENILEATRALRDSPDLAFDLLLDVTCVDFFGQPDGFQNAPETWDRNHSLVRKRAEWRHRVTLPARGEAPRFALVYPLVSTRLL